MDLFPQSTQAGFSDGHDNQRGTIFISTNVEDSISHEVVIISDDGFEEPRSTKEGGDRSRRRRRCGSRRRWTLSEDCKLVEVVASHCQKVTWKTIAAEFPQRTSTSCRLRWIKLFKPEDAFTDSRWSEMTMMVGDHVMDQWRLMLAQNTPTFYMFISANHPLKRSSVQNVVPMISNPSVGGDDLSLSLATRHN